MLMIDIHCSHEYTSQLFCTVRMDHSGYPGSVTLTVIIKNFRPRNFELTFTPGGFVRSCQRRQKWRKWWPLKIYVSVRLFTAVTNIQEQQFEYERYILAQGFIGFYLWLVGFIGFKTGQKYQGGSAWEREALPPRTMSRTSWQGMHA